jgi:hypothetical protein
MRLRRAKDAKRTTSPNPSQVPLKGLGPNLLSLVKSNQSVTTVYWQRLMVHHLPPAAQLVRGRAGGSRPLASSRLSV